MVIAHWTDISTTWRAGIGEERCVLVHIWHLVLILALGWCWLNISPMEELYFILTRMRMVHIETGNSHRIPPSPEQLCSLLKLWEPGICHFLFSCFFLKHKCISWIRVELHMRSEPWRNVKNHEENLSSKSLTLWETLPPAMFSVSLVETQRPPDDSHFLVPCTHLVLCYFSLEVI